MVTVQIPGMTCMSGISAGAVTPSPGWSSPMPSGSCSALSPRSRPNTPFRIEPALSSHTSSPCASRSTLPMIPGSTTTTLSSCSAIERLRLSSAFTRQIVNGLRRWKPALAGPTVIQFGFCHGGILATTSL